MVEKCQKEIPSNAEEKLKSKVLYKLVLFSVKTIPVLISGIYVLNTILSYYWIDVPILSYLVMGLFIVFLYLASYAFRFCEWHRMFIHYISINFILNVIDYYCEIPLGDREMFVVYISITGMCLFGALWLKLKCKE